MYYILPARNHLKNIPDFSFSFSSLSERSYHPLPSLTKTYVRGGSAGYVTTIHLFSGDTINQNKLGWERENRLPAPREAIPLGLCSSSFVAACACRVHLEHKRIH